MVSVINDYGHQNIPAFQWTPNTFNEYKEILRKLEALDAKLGQPDCESPEKSAWMKDVEKRLAELEKSGSPQL
jgi:hypothetical protein